MRVSKRHTSRVSGPWNNFSFELVIYGPWFLICLVIAYVFQVTLTFLWKNKGLESACSSLVLAEHMLSASFGDTNIILSSLKQEWFFYHYGHIYVEWKALTFLSAMSFQIYVIQNSSLT